MTPEHFFGRRHITVAKIILSTLNSTYQHSAFGLRYLYANMKELQRQTAILEFTTAQKPQDIVEKLLRLEPEIVGFGVYIWNTREIYEVVHLLKLVAPQVRIVLGGPEISFETEKQALSQKADYVVKGEADFLFYELCRDLLQGHLPSSKLISGPLPAIDQIQLPYAFYDENDIKNRILYVEASRGCPYKCEYCLSSLDVSVRNFPLENFLHSLQGLIDRGARSFKFVDRTFNLSPRISTRILEFFLSHADKNLFLHFEMVPDRLPAEIKTLIEKFPPGSLQFEIGIQTWNPQVAANVSRRQDYSKVTENLRYLKEKTRVHTHADLIVGLPGETLMSFAEGFDQLVELEPDEVQVGILKRLKGTPIVRHDQTYKMIYSEHPPFQLVQNRDVNYFEMQAMGRFSKFWDLVANSGHFPNLLRILRQKAKDQKGSFFWTFFDLMEFLHVRHPHGHGIALLNLAESLWRYLEDKMKLDPAQAREIIIQDYSVVGRRDIPRFLRLEAQPIARGIKDASRSERQRRHIRASDVNSDFPN